MGAADIVPGVSGGTVALVLGIYERLIRNVHTGAHALKEILQGRLTEAAATLRKVEWLWLLSLLAGILTAIAVLSSVIEDLLHDHPVRMSGLFFGLVAGSMLVAWRLVRSITAREIGVMIAVAIVLFLVLGLRADTVQRLTPYLTLLPAPTPLNLNTASREVLSSVVKGMDLATAERLVQLRQRDPFKTLGAVEALDHLTGELVSLADGLLLDHHRAVWLDLAGPALTDRR